MGGWFAWFQKDEIAGLEKEKEKRVKMRDMLDDEIEAIDEKIAELKSKKKD